MKNPPRVPRRAVLLSAIALALFPPIAWAAEPVPLKVCLVSGSIEYQSNESLAELQKYLEANFPVKCSRAFLVGDDVEHLPGLENLDDCDVMLLFTRRLELSGDDLARIKKYCLSGRPIVGVRTASHAIQSWLEFDKQILGGNYQGHHGNDLETRVAIVEAAKNHPVLACVTPFSTRGSLYKNQGIADDVTLLMTGANPDTTEPITWTREVKGGRVVYTSLGHPDDFHEPSFQRLLVNALFWTAGRNVPAE
ncbi:MAG: ThuA domain-containing protein [Pirellulales bacterium]